MNSAANLLRRIDNPNLSASERAQLRCRLAKDLKEAGDYEGARRAMGELWQQVGERPKTAGLDRPTTAEVIMCAGSLSGWIGGLAQAEEMAKGLISESIAIFEDLQEAKRVAEAQSELALCYWREGLYDEASEMLRDALRKLSDEDGDLKTMALIRNAVVELSANNLHDALRILAGSASLFEISPSHAIKGKFHLTLAAVLRALGADEHREEYIDRALVEYTAASFHLEKAGHTSDWASVENNLGVMCFRMGRLTEAHDHLKRARHLLERLKDHLRVAEVDDTRARVLLAEGRNSEAEKVVRASVQALEKEGMQPLLAQTLTTHGVTLARLGLQDRSRRTLQRVLTEAAEAGHPEEAGRAGLTIIEELGACLTIDEMRSIYERADRLLSEWQDAETLTRLRNAVRQVLAAEERMSARASTPPTFIYAVEQMAGLLREAHRVAPTNHTVLISGETGTGKEVLAHMIHEWSGRAGEFVNVSCAALSEERIDSDLFGHRRGSFASADKDLPGAVQQAEGGTLFLDGITDLSLNSQGKLLRLIEHGEIHAVGAPLPERIDVRIIAATNRKLKQEVERKRFRKELFYRLQAFHIEIPPLRERVADIPVIADHLIKELKVRYGKRVTFTPEAIEAIQRLPLKGNVLELRSLIERMMLTADESATVTADSIKEVALGQTERSGRAEGWKGCSLEAEVRRYEGELIRHALEDEKGSVTRAARLLGVTHQGLAFILHGRQKELLHARTPVKRRRRSILGTARKRKNR